MSSCQAEYQSSRSPPLTIPNTHRLIPASSPTHGSIEAIVPQRPKISPSPRLRVVQLNCVFGDIPAHSTTQHWTDNALVCILFLRASQGVVTI
ncbi:hypothetical protein EV702DRAFT_1137164 [Suillus placidus]|uniref:Uncharacterized protein n=1 Tax=Suillus placidus TaxID=48579 RepID=A0A9P6ZM05_9AGAM|nr:hypothetical protein EV702DRAFT_1137164 [Suillus placidus]